MAAFGYPVTGSLFCPVQPAAVPAPARGATVPHYRFLIFVITLYVV
jgi:hypothetical protein